ncbi:hypothetical protein Nepgr_032344 [Nepenthes gracilis]|uniref:High chlorophyll fluorescence 153 n=1 Tax=Nepenthes gracilis TaxID=150966 RepID=A0AAD3TK46_NEPGR|nr:hypothetical protein Nepgr_032344 [Nepenthes gracilis]
MATMLTCTSFCPTLYLSQKAIQSTTKVVCFRWRSAVRFAGKIDSRRKRGVNVVTRAGPSTSSYVFAFVFPLTLLAITIFAAMRIGDRLDEKFLEELAINEALREVDEEDDDSVISVEEEPALSRTRNRPKREV